MDRKSVIVLTLSFILLIAWFPLMTRLYPPAPVSETDPVAEVETIPGTTNNAPRLAASPDAPAIPAPTRPAMPVVEEPAGPEETMVLENEWGRYTFTSRGGGLAAVDLKQFPATVEAGSSAPATDSLARLNARAKLPILSLVAPWSTNGEGNFKLKTLSANRLEANKTLADGLVITKQFTLAEDYTIQSSVTFSNSTTEALTLLGHEVVVGTASPGGPKDDPTLMGVFIYNGQKKIHQQAAWFDNRSFGCGPANPRDRYETDGEQPVVWAAAHNQFFALAAMPKEPAPQLVTRRVELNEVTVTHEGKPTKAESTTHGFQNGFPYRGSVLEPGMALSREFEFYAGPKELKTLTKLGGTRSNNLDLIMDLDGFFGFFSKILLLSMNLLHGVGISYGGAIIAITVIIKLLFWPLTNASTKSMKRMAAVQPQMKALQEKYKDDPKKLNQKMMEMWKEHKINPLGGCLPMLIQMPVFFGFFFMIRTAIELRGAEFLWIYDLSTSDTVFTIPGIGFPINPMSFLMGITMVVQMRLTPVSPTMDPMQAKMMKYMPLMFLVFLYNFSSGLTLYWTVQNILSIVQTKLTKTNDPAPGQPGATPAVTPPKQPAIVTSSKKRRK